MKYDLSTSRNPWFEVMFPRDTKNFSPHFLEYKIFDFPLRKREKSISGTARRLENIFAKLFLSPCYL